MISRFDHILHAKTTNTWFWFGASIIICFLVCGGIFLRVPLVSSIHGDNLHLELYSLLKSISANLQHAQNLLKWELSYLDSWINFFLGAPLHRLCFIRTWTLLCMSALFVLNHEHRGQSYLAGTETSWLIKMRLSIWSFKGKAFLVTLSPWVLLFRVCSGLSRYQRSPPSL